MGSGEPKTGGTEKTRPERPIADTAAGALSAAAPAGVGAGTGTRRQLLAIDTAFAGSSLRRISGEPGEMEGRIDPQQPAEPPLRGTWVVLLALAGVGIGVAVVWGDHARWSSDQRQLESSGEFLLWATLMCTQSAVWLVAFASFWGIHWNISHPGGRLVQPMPPKAADIAAMCRKAPQAISSLRGRSAWSAVGDVFLLLLISPWHLLQAIRRLLGQRVFWPTLAMTAGVLAVLALGAVGPDVESWRAYDFVPQRSSKIAFLGLLGSMIALYGVVGMWRIYFRAKDGLRKTGEESKDVDGYLALHENLQLFLVILGALLGLTILAAAAERNLVLGYHDKVLCPEPNAVRRALGLVPKCESAHFPPEYLLLYGFAFTTLLAFAYLPVQSTLVAYGRRIREAFAPTQCLQEAHADVRAWHDKRDALDEILQLKVGAGANFRATIAILTPLVGALTSLLFKAG